MVSSERHPGPWCDCLVRWKDFDVSHDSWVNRTYLTPLALQSYEWFLTKHVPFCEEHAKNSKINEYDQQLKSARERLLSFTGNGNHTTSKVLSGPGSCQFPPLNHGQSTKLLLSKLCINHDNLGIYDTI
jgi:hypothetical protein